MAQGPIVKQVFPLWEGRNIIKVGFWPNLAYLRVGMVLKYMISVLVSYI